MAVVTADEAGRLVAEEMRRSYQSVVPRTLDRIRKLQAEEVFSICNVGPWDYRVERAALQMYIPGYDKSQDLKQLGYAASDPLPAMWRETKLTGGGGDGPLEYGWIEDDGRAVALDLIGVGFGMAQRNALTQYGVFVPSGAKPTREEIAAARDLLAGYCDRLIAEARDAYDKGPEERKAVISDRHLWAARERGLDEKWVHHQHTQESVKCEMCGKYNPAGIAKCSCGTIINFDLFMKIEAEQQRMLERATAPKK